MNSFIELFERIKSIGELLVRFSSKEITDIDRFFNVGEIHGKTLNNLDDNVFRF